MSINKENTNKQQLVIVNEDKKLNYIEYIIKNNREMETIISNFIDYTCEQKLLEAEKCRILIKEKQPENYDKIIYAANGLIYDYDLVIS